MNCWSICAARNLKKLSYVTEDESRDTNERFQKIYQNHKDNVQNYPLVKPISILVTQNIKSAKALYNELVEFLAKEEEKSKEDATTKVLIVTSAREHKANVAKLKFVDNKAEKTEWIISVSMLTEGWDVKNVFQIIPWEDRAFNSKLLVAQVLGRGLRIPEEYRLPQPKVTVFNHKAWGSKIKRLADEVLEIETRVDSIAVKNGERYKYHFCVKNINYLTNPIEVEKIAERDSLDFDRIMKEGIPLESQSVMTEQKTTFETVSRSTFSKDYQIRHITWTIDEVVDKLFDEFEQREAEYKTFGLGEEEYTRDALPSRQKVENIIRFSMEKRGNTGDEIVEKNVHAILAAFTPLLHKNKKSIVSCSVPDDICALNTTLLAKQTTSVGMLRQGRTVYFTNQWAEEIQAEEQKEIISELREDESLPRSALREINYGLFKTPVTTVFTSSEPERTFVDLLCKKENADQVAAWIKSRDRNFYEIEYSYQYSSDNTKPKKHFHGKFNPDFFLKIEKDGKTVYLVIEIKENGDDCEENKAKYRCAVQHFAELNKRLQEKGENEQYIFHFLSPDGYDAFFHHLKDGSILKSQAIFRCSLENLLEVT